jgi:phenylpyruvate tautomerase PptA (4-oxalocrotonate tautomerase family)
MGSIPVMPLLQIQTSSKAASSGAPAGLLQTLSAELARELGKPESYMMVAFETDAEILFGGTAEPACFCALKNIGTFSPDQTERVSALLTKNLSAALSVPPSRIYIEFVDAKPHLWGHDGGTFA